MLIRIVLIGRGNIFINKQNCLNFSWFKITTDRFVEFKISPFCVVESGVIGERLDSVSAQLAGDVLALVPRQAVDDAGLSHVLALKEKQQIIK